MITLNANVFLGALTNLIAYSQVANTMERGKVGDFVGSFQNISVENGDGKVVLSADIDLTKVSNLSGTSSLLTANKPTVDEQYISVENYKVIPMTINRYLMRGAFVEESQLATFTAYLLGILQATKTAYLSAEIIKELEAYVPTQATQTVTITTIDTTGLTDPMQLNAANQYNAKAIQKAMINTLAEMGFPTNKFNDATFTEVIDNSSLKLIERTGTATEILVESLASLLNSNKITEAEKWGETYTVPNSQFTDATNTFVAWLMHKDKIQYGYFYQVATSFFDGSTLNQNDWLHFAYYLDTVKALPCVCFVLDPSLTPAALS